MIEIIFLIAIVVFLTTHYLYSRSIPLLVFITSPWFVFSCFFYFIHVLMPFLQWRSNYFRYQKSYEISNYGMSMVYALIAYILVFIVLYASKYRSKLKEFTYTEKVQSITYSSTFIKKLFFCGIGIYLIGLLFAAKNLFHIFSIGQNEYLIDRINFGRSRGIEILLSHWLYISCILFSFIWLVAKGIDKVLKRKILFMVFVSFCSVLVYYGINSNRNSILILLVSVVFIFFSYTKLKSNTLFLGKIIGIFFVFGLLFFQLGKKRRQAMMKNDKASYTLIEEFNNAFGNHENFVWLLENKEKSELYFGKTYIAGITNFIPRKMWKDKPLGAGPLLRNTIKPGAYIVGKPKNNSLTTGLLTELHMNFGIYGLLLGSLLYGMLLKNIGLLLINTSSLASLFIIHFSLIIFSSIFIYSEFLGFLSRYVITILPLLIIKFTLKK
ncbi:O-antigen polymerase [Dokdonia sp.]|uniref:O-antigen polymerase n=1 Tax=Dokdonia sp. TaxID=2024995 RepID=UPI0032636AC6